MSKCGINRYKAGGRCGTVDSGQRQTAGGMTDSQLGVSLSAMLSAREAQDAALKMPIKQYATPALQQVAMGQAIVMKQPEAKQKDIDFILQGDLD
jgi:hypothetical protein